MFWGFWQIAGICNCCVTWSSFSFTALKILCVLPIHFLLSLTPDTCNLFIMLIVLPSLECHMVGVIWDSAFSYWFSNMQLRFHVFSWIDSSFLFSAECYSIVWTSLCPFSYQENETRWEKSPSPKSNWAERGVFSSKSPNTNPRAVPQSTAASHGRNWRCLNRYENQREGNWRSLK